MDVFRVGMGFTKQDKFSSWVGGTVVTAYTPCHDPNALALPQTPPPDRKVSMLDAATSEEKVVV